MLGCEIGEDERIEVDEALPVLSRGQQVCACFNVTDLAIEEHLAHSTAAPAQRLASLQDSLKCGTNCGSCLPQLQRMLAKHLTTSA